MAGLERVIRAVLIALVGAMTLVVLAAVVMRYLFDSSLPWAEEVTRYMFIYTIFLGAAVGVRHGIHVRLNLFERAAAIHLWLERVAKFLVTGFLLVLAWYGGQLVQTTMSQKSPALGIPIGLVYLAIPLGALLALAFTWGPKAQHIDAKGA